MAGDSGVSAIFVFRCVSWGRSYGYLGPSIQAFCSNLFFKCQRLAWVRVGPPPEPNHSEIVAGAVMMSGARKIILVPVAHILKPFRGYFVNRSGRQRRSPLSGQTNV